MPSHHDPFNVRPVPAVIESLEPRGYLSVDPTAGCVGMSAGTPTTVATTQIRSSVTSGNESKKTALATGAFSAQKVNPPVDLTPQTNGIVKRNKNGHYIVPQILISNAGPTTAKGTLRISVEFSYYMSGASPLAFRTVNTHINIPAGGSKAVRIGGNIPKSYAAFDYHMVAVINSNKTIPETNYGNDTEVSSSYFYLA